MKKGVILFSALFLLMLILPPIIAQGNDSNDSADITISSSSDSGDESSKVDNAYNCLKDKVKDDCSTSLEENIFTLLAIKECKDEVEDKSSNDECWPSGDCNIKITAQAALALNRAGENTDDAEDWLISQNDTPLDIDWYLQIDSDEETICSIDYDSLSSPVDIIIRADRKIDSGAGSCLDLTEDKYWLRVSPSCYDEEFEISCDKGFLTNLLYKKTDSPTVYVSDTTKSASAEGTTIEKVNSFCFAKSGTCDYEGSLWAAMVLDYLDYDVSPYIPYLVVMADEAENKKYLPETFLYTLTGYAEFRTDLLAKQKDNKYWDESGNKFYDTAMALYPLQYESSQEKDKSKDWLLEIQGKDGCWDNGNIKSTAFILFSLWPKGSLGGGSTSLDCKTSGYYCMSRMNCEGDVLDDYDCAGAYICCDTEKPLETCSEMNGKTCSSNEICIGGSSVSAGDTDNCCVDGYCGEPEQKSNCELAGGICKSYGCDKGYDVSEESCDSSSETCCIKEITTSGKSYLWIWVLMILIILAILAIIFKDKIRPYWFMIKSKFKKSKPGEGGILYPASPRTPPSGMMPRRIFPPQRNFQIRRPMPPKHKEIDDVLKKLKEMGK